MRIPGFSGRCGSGSFIRTFAEGRVVDLIERSDRSSGLLLELLRSADLGIVDVVLVRPSLDAALFAEVLDARLRGAIADDSLPDLLECLENGSVLVIDEIDINTSLHPLLVRKLIEIFRSPRHNPRGGQLIFTTHDAYLLAPVEGEAALERDQVWFVEKSADGCSRLYPLSDFHPRNEHNLARRYLGGAYGAVPFLDELDGLTAPLRNDGSTNR